MKHANVCKVLVVSSVLAFSGHAFAEDPNCGEPKDASWLEPNTVQEQIELLGYTVESLDVTDGNCYQMTGVNVKGNNIMAFIDPRTGSVVQEDIVE